MALKGNLKDFGITQLFNLINLARKTGSLTIDGANGAVQMYFREGRLIHASLNDQRGRLTAILVKAGKINEEQSRAIEAGARVHTDKELGLLLINAGYVTQADIVQTVKSAMLETVYALFTWLEGMFRFEPNLQPSEDLITVPVSLDSIIMEGTRRIKEWENLRQEIPDLDVPLKFTERHDTTLRRINLSPDEWRVISFINPRNTIRQIAGYNGLSDFQIRKIVHDLQTKGLVEVLGPRPVEAEAPPVAPRERPLQLPRPVKRGVILRLIDRIRKI